MDALESDIKFLEGGGAMGERIRAFAWQATSLGRPQFWPQGLRTAVRLLLTTRHPIFVFWGPEHICLYNDAYSCSLGPEKHPSILGAPGRAAWSEIWSSIGPQIEQVMTGNGATWHENQLLPILRQGRLQDVYWTYSYSPIDEPDAPCGVGGVLVVCTETTEQVLAKQTLAVNLSRLDYATRLSGVGFWYCDLPFDVLEWDDRVKEHFFFPPSARITIDDFYARIHEDDRAPTRDAIAASVRDRTPYDIVYRTVHPTSGAVKWIRALGGTDYASDGTPTHFDGVTVDVSAQKRAQHELSMLNDQLREHDRRKDEFIATLSHELRNPLAPVRAAAKVIVSPRVSASQQQRAQAIIERQVMHMSVLLDDLLDVARITQGKLRIRKRAVALVDIVDAAVEAVRPALGAKNHRLSLSVPDGAVTLEADPVRLSQVLSNLLMNASKYSNAGGHIEIRAVAETDAVCIAIRDEGIGIAADAIGGLFRMFSQIDEGQGMSEGGLGIGLALAKGLVELHGGTVEARSAGLGHGSEFVVRVPRGEQSPRTGRDEHRPTFDGPARRRILLADDNEDAAESLCMLLELAGHEVRVTHRGREAVALAKLFRPDVAVLDIGMPDLSGYEVARLLRKEPWALDLRLVALTGWGQDDDRRRALEAGFDHHLTKPLDPDSLTALISDSTAGHHSIG